MFLKKNGYKILLFFIFFVNLSYGSNNNGYHEDIVSHKTNFSFLVPPKEKYNLISMYLPTINKQKNKKKEKRVYWEDLNPNKNKFLVFYFMDIYCPFTTKNLPSFLKFVAYMKYYYSDLLKPIVIEALPRKWGLVENFISNSGLEGIDYYESPDMDMNSYLNVDSTPTIIIIDPFGNIVDKIEENKSYPLYVVHLEYIIGNFLLSQGVHNWNGIDVRNLITPPPGFLINRMKESLVEYGLLSPDNKLNYSKKEIEEIEENPKEDNNDF